MIEHDIGVVMDLSDRVVVLEYGRKIADDVPDVVKSDPTVIDAYLGVGALRADPMNLLHAIFVDPFAQMISRARSARRRRSGKGSSAACSMR